MSSANSRISTYADFIRSHEILLLSAGLPPSLHRQLFDKLMNETFDAGSCFSVEELGGGSRRVVFNGTSDASW